MTDIVERLRASAELWGDDTLFNREMAAMERDAANEIERLRSVLERIAESRDAGRHDGLREECPLHDQYTMWFDARAALSDKQIEELERLYKDRTLGAVGDKFRHAVADVFPARMSEVKQARSQEGEAAQQPTPLSSSLEEEELQSAIELTERINIDYNDAIVLSRVLNKARAVLRSHQSQSADLVKALEEIKRLRATLLKIDKLIDALTPKPTKEHIAIWQGLSRRKRK